MKQSVQLKSIKNARELGGYRTADGRRIKDGVLLRTGRLKDISDEDVRTLTNVYSLGHIVDFRMAMEIPGAEDPVIEGAVYHQLDVIDMSGIFAGDKPDKDFDMSKLDPFKAAELTIQSGIQNDRMYIGFLDGEMGKRAYSDFFRILLSADPDRAVLWHCTSGKDRTGLAAMMLMTALGVDEETIIEDYLLTNTYNAESISAVRAVMEERGYDEDFIKQAVIVFDAVDESYMRNAIAWLKKEYGSVSGYIRDAMSISDAEIDSLKEKYLI